MPGGGNILALRMTHMHATTQARMDLAENQRKWLIQTKPKLGHDQPTQRIKNAENNKKAITNIANGTLASYEKQWLPVETH